MAGPTIGLDELLGRAEDPGPEPDRRRSTGAWLLRALAAAAVVGGVVVLVLRAAGIGLAYPSACGAVFGLLALRRLLGALDVPEHPRRTARREPEPDEPRGSADALRRALLRWEVRLDWAHTDGARFAREVRPQLLALVEERLRQRHGVTLAGDPARARALLGDPLWTFLTGPGHPPVRRRQLAAMLDRLDAA
ncbi:MAG TPA: hypothetical protein VNV66_04540 [Pilimelia sp.]|nr:hypothetical protein [Pilimelia sp.]